MSALDVVWHVIGTCWSLACLWLVWAVARHVRQERRRNRDVRRARSVTPPRGLFLEREDVA